MTVDEIIKRAARDSRKSSDVWREVWRPAAAAIRAFNLTFDEYFAALSRLTEAMKI
jgi:hypothetical protein